MRTRLSTDTPLPPGWCWVKLGEVCEINPRRRSDITYPLDTPTTFVPMASVNGSTGTIQRPEVRPLKEISKGYTYFEEGDVLFAKITPCLQNGKHAAALNLINGFGFGTTEFHVIRARSHIIFEWVHRFLRQPHVLSQATKHFRGAVGQQRVPKEFLQQLPIPLPPLEEQRSIVAELDAQLALVERARRAAEEMLEAACALPPALVGEILPSKGQNLPHGWRWVKLGEVCEFFDYRRRPINQSERNTRKAGKSIGELYPYYGANGQVDMIDDYLFDEPAILLAEDGGFFGSTHKPIAYLVEGKYWVNNHAHVLRRSMSIFCIMHSVSVLMLGQWFLVQHEGNSTKR